MSRDESAEEGLAREVLEETGYRCHQTKLFRVVTGPDRPSEDRQNVELVFTAELGDLIGEPDNEVSEVRWFAFEELPPQEMIAFDHADNLQQFLAYTNGAERPL